MKYSQAAPSKALRPLVYDLHEPAQSKNHINMSPVLFLHGLFGSKKNNRGISKSVNFGLGLQFLRAELMS